MPLLPRLLPHARYTGTIWSIEKKNDQSISTLSFMFSRAIRYDDWDYRNSHSEIDNTFNML